MPRILGDKSLKSRGGNYRILELSILISQCLKFTNIYGRVEATESHIITELWSHISEKHSYSTLPVLQPKLCSELRGWTNR